MIAYNADGGRGNGRLAYVGQDLYQSGLEFGARVARLVGEGDVALFIATPGRSTAAARRRRARRDPRLRQAHPRGGRRHRGRLPRRASPDRRDLSRAHPKLRGLFAADGGSTQAVAELVRRRRLRRTGSGPAATTSCRARCAGSATGSSTSRSTSSPTSRATCRSSSSSSRATAAASSHRRTRIPACSSSRAATSAPTSRRDPLRGQLEPARVPGHLIAPIALNP